MKFCVLRPRACRFFVKTREKNKHKIARKHGKLLKMKKNKKRSTETFFSFLIYM